MTLQTRTIALRWAALVAWASVIFFLSAQASLELSPDPVINFVTRKAAHMFFYAVFAVLAWWAFTASDVRRPALFALILAGLYAASDEFHQSFVPGRSPLVTDVLIDIVGASIGLGTIHWIVARRRRSA